VIEKTWACSRKAALYSPCGSITTILAFGKEPDESDILIRWAKEGRQPGLSLVVASQQPSAIDAEILTQCGIRIVHRITSKDDYRAIDALSQDYLSEGLPNRIKQLNGPGQTLLIDDDRESVIPVQVRPRQSLHGGFSA